MNNSKCALRSLLVYLLALHRPPEEGPAAGTHLPAVVRVLAGLLAAHVADPGGVVGGGSGLVERYKLLNFELRLKLSNMMKESLMKANNSDLGLGRSP